MTWAEQISYGTEVLVPRHHKPRGTTRAYDTGVVIGMRQGVATIRLDVGRDVLCPVGLLLPRQDRPE